MNSTYFGNNFRDLLRIFRLKKIINFLSHRLINFLRLTQISFLILTQNQVKLLRIIRKYKGIWNVSILMLKNHIRSSINQLWSLISQNGKYKLLLRYQNHSNFQMMKITVFCLFLIGTTSLVSNCNFQSKNKCLSCYYGFQLKFGKCQNCISGFAMINESCVKVVFQQEKVQVSNRQNSQDASSNSSLKTQLNNSLDTTYTYIPTQSSETKQYNNSIVVSQTSLQNSQNSQDSQISQKDQSTQGFQINLNTQTTIDTVNLLLTTQKNQDDQKSQTQINDTFSSTPFTSPIATKIESNQSSVSGPLPIIPSDLNCKSLIINGFCSQCYFGFYFNFQTRSCLHVNPLCQTWNNLGYCLSCYEGYTLSNTQCLVSQRPPAITSSFSASSSGFSPIISSGISPQSSTQILDLTSESSGMIVLIITDPKCLKQNVDGLCVKCLKSFYYDSINAKRCVPVNNLCKQWNEYGQCLSCYQGYILSAKRCLIQSDYKMSIDAANKDFSSNYEDPNCNTYKDQVCIKCASHTYFDPTINRCLAVDSKCKLWTQLGICTSCYQGYFVYNLKQCRALYPQITVEMKPSLNSDLNCRVSDSDGICTSCNWRYVLNLNTKICQKVSDLCNKWNQMSGLCTSCYGGYSLTTSGQCQLST